MTVESWIVGIVGLVCSAGLAVLLAPISGGNFGSIIALGLGQVAGFVALCGAASLLSQPITGKTLDWKQASRTLGYAMTPGLLGLIPIVGIYLALWRLVTVATAFKAVTGADWPKSIVLFIVSGVAYRIAEQLTLAILGSII